MGGRYKVKSRFYLLLSAVLSQHTIAETLFSQDTP